MKSFSLLSWAALIVALPNCTRQDEFHSEVIGEIQFDTNPVEVEFSLPDADDVPIAISGELIEGDLNIKNFSSTVNFQIVYFYKNGYRKSSEWVFPKVANWHNPQASFVISKEINGDYNNTINKIKLSIKEVDSGKRNKARIRVYANYLR